MANIEKRVSQAGLISYRVLIRLKGYPAQSATFRRVTDAKKWELQTEAAIREGRYFQVSEAKKHTFNELVSRYCSEILPSYNPERTAKPQPQAGLVGARHGRLPVSGHYPGIVDRTQNQADPKPRHRGQVS
jgi:hypothetical protein